MQEAQAFNTFNLSEVKLQSKTSLQFSTTRRCLKLYSPMPTTLKLSWSQWTFVGWGGTVTNEQSSMGPRMESCGTPEAYKAVLWVFALMQCWPSVSWGHVDFHWLTENTKTAVTFFRWEKVLCHGETSNEYKQIIQQYEQNITILMFISAQKKVTGIRNCLLMLNLAKKKAFYVCLGTENREAESLAPSLSTWLCYLEEQHSWCKHKATHRQKARLEESQLHTTVTARIER